GIPGRRAQQLGGRRRRGARVARLGAGLRAARTNVRFRRADLARASSGTDLEQMRLPPLAASLAPITVSLVCAAAPAAALAGSPGGAQAPAAPAPSTVRAGGSEF